jgi:hypothetical protein
MSDAPIFVVIGGAGMFPLAIHEQTCNPGTPLDLRTPRVVKHADHLAALTAVEMRATKDRLHIGYAIAGKRGLLHKLWGGNAPERIQGEIDAALALNAALSVAQERCEKLEVALQDASDALDAVQHMDPDIIKPAADRARVALKKKQ